MRTIIVKLFSFLLLIGVCQQLKAQSIRLRFPDTTVVKGNVVDYPLYVDSSLTGKGVMSFQLKLDFYSDYVDVLSIETSGTVMALSGTVFHSFNKSTHKLAVSWAGSSSLSGSGVLFYIRVLAKTGGFYPAFSGGNTDNFMNQGNPLLTFQSGTFSIVNPPTIQAYFANTNPLTMGDSVQVYVSGGIPPYIYKVLNPSVAYITTGGMLKSTGSGSTKVRVLSSNGVADTTDVAVDIRRNKIWIPDTTILPVSRFELPLYINSTDSSFIASGTFRVNFSPNAIIPDSIIVAGTLLQGKVITTKIFSDHAIISFASTTFLLGAGKLISIRFKVVAPNSSYLSVQDILFNESVNANNGSGSVFFVAVPTLSVSPNSKEFYSNETQQFNASGGYPPYSFEVTDTLKGSILPNGFFTANEGGVVKVMVRDSLGSVVFTNPLQVYDARLLFPTINVQANAVINYPIFLTNLTGGKPITSFQAVLTFPANTLDSFDVILQPGNTNGWTVVKKVGNNSIEIAMAGALPVATNGLFFTLRAKVTATVGQGIPIYVSDLLINEGNFYAKVVNGNIGVVASLQSDMGINTYQMITSSCTKDIPESIHASIHNWGNITALWGDTVWVGYTINNGPVVMDTIILSDQLSQYQVQWFSYQVKANFAAPGTYTVKMFTRLNSDVNAGNDTAVMTFQVYGNPVVQFGNDTSICSGGGYILNAFNPGCSYQWNTSSTNSFIQVDTSGTYWVKINSPYGCFASDTISMIVNPKPITSSITGRTNVHIDTAATYVVANTIGSNYNWFVVGGVQISGGVTHSIDVDWDSLYFGKVSVVETNLFGCMGDTVSLTMTSILPISLRVFSGKRISSGVELSWITASEENSSHFEIERSLDNQQFQRVGGVNGSGNSLLPITYLFEDDNATAFFKLTNQLYYRLKHFDFDGRWAYSNTVVVADQSNAYPNILLYPSPSHSYITVKGLSSPAVIVDVLGNYMNRVEADGVIDISGFAPGMYTVVTAEGSVRFIKE